MNIEIDASRVVDMLARIAGRLSGVDAAVEEAAQETAPMVTVNVLNLSGRSTGALAASIHAEGDEIGSDLPYARFVFTHEGHGPAQPPDVPAEAMARVLAERVAGVLFE